MTSDNQKVRNNLTSIITEMAAVMKERESHVVKYSHYIIWTRYIWGACLNQRDKYPQLLISIHEVGLYTILLLKKYVRSTSTSRGRRGGGGQGPRRHRLCRGEGRLWLGRDEHTTAQTQVSTVVMCLVVGSMTCGCRSDHRTQRSLLSCHAAAGCERCASLKLQLQKKKIALILKFSICIIFDTLTNI